VKHQVVLLSFLFLFSCSGPLDATRCWSLCCREQNSFHAHELTGRSKVCLSSILAVIFARVAYGLLQGGSRSCFELPDQKNRGFLFPIALNRLFPERVHQVFDEIHVRI
jgi:hypothetical protein